MKEQVSVVANGLYGESDNNEAVYFLPLWLNKYDIT